MNTCYALLGANVAIRNAKNMVLKAISSESGVLIVGGNGTGKTDVAHFIHQESSHREHSFVVVQCATIQESTLEREFQQAQNGTLFFQDIDKLSPRLQFVFMKAIQNFSINLNKSENVSPAHLMASSSIDLENFVHRGFFREDLYLKFAKHVVYLPSLQERREDIPMLVNYFVQQSNNSKGSKITAVSSDAMKVFLQHNWPNNLEELHNLIERVSILKNVGNIELSDLPPRLRTLISVETEENYKENPIIEREIHVKPEAMNIQDMDKNKTSVESAEMSAIDQFIKKDIDLGNGIDFYRIVEAFENKLLQEALKRAQHNKNRAAQLLSMNRTTLVEKLRKRHLFKNLCLDEAKGKFKSSFTVFDGLGTERKKFDNQTYMTITGD